MCKYCEDENKYEICVCHGIWKIWVDKNKLRLYVNDIGVEDETTIRYCPMCGKKLGE